MKKTLFFLSLLLMLAHAAVAQTSTPFITHWRGGTDISLGVNGAVDYTLYDSSTNAVVTPTTNFNNGNITIGGLNAATTYNLHIRYNTAASSRRFYSGINTQLTYLRGVSQWGDTKWTSMYNAFNYARNLTTLPADTPTTYLVTNYNYMFRNTSVFNQDLSDWNVGKGDNFIGVFNGATAFNQDLSRWDVSQGRIFTDMFHNASAFNQDLSDWNVSQGTNFSGMFNGATAFNQDLSDWDVSEGVDFSGMFNTAVNFNQELSDWDVSQGTNFSYMFYDASAFNGDLSNWDVSEGVNFSGMFNNAINFNQDLSDWIVSQGTNFSYMFEGASAFNGNLNSWNTSNGTNFSYMFYDASTFNGNLSNWDVSQGVNFSGMFQSAGAFNQDLSRWDVSKATTFTAMFQGAKSFNQDLSSWNVSLVTSFHAMFYNASTFNVNLSSWRFSNTGSGTINMRSIFDGTRMSCTNLDATLVGWADYAPSRPVTLTLGSIPYTTSIGAPAIALLSGIGWNITGGTAVAACPVASTPLISKWKGSTTINGVSVSGALYWDLYDSLANRVAAGNNSITISVSNLREGMEYTLHIVYDLNATARTFGLKNAYLRSIESWGNTAWTSMQEAFMNAINLTILPADTPTTYLVTNYSSMFSNARLFNVDLSNWNVRNGTSFQQTFQNARAFNVDLSSWDVSEGINFSRMFYSATAFNQDLSSWNVSNGTNFSSMFQGATTFNQDLSDWDVSQGTNFSNMFSGATTFNQDLSDWELSSLAPTGLSGMFNRAGIDCANLSTSLIGWANNPNTASGITMDLTGRYYSTSAVAAIATLGATPYNWIITPGLDVPDEDCYPIQLPIHLLSFGAQTNGTTAVDLNWEIVEDEEVQLYTIERSTPHTAWHTLTTLAPTEAKAPSKSYMYTDQQPMNGVNLYRLKITEVFGTTTYSKVAKVNFATASSINVYPNPATAHINIAAANATLKTITLHNAQGQKMYSIAVDGVMEHQIDLSPLASGVYFLYVTCADGSTSNEKVIKQ